MDSLNYARIGLVLRWYGIRRMTTFSLPLLRGAVDKPIGVKLVGACGTDVALPRVARSTEMETSR